MKRHELKTDPAVFEAVATGAKTHEIRLNDRDYAVGDELWLRETVYTGAEMAAGAELLYTSRETLRTVSHIQTGYGLQEGWCILSFEEAPTGVTGHAPRGWWVGEMRAIFKAAQGDPITADMKRAANIVLKIVNGEKFDENRHRWTPGEEGHAAELDYATRLARFLWSTHYSATAPGWEPQTEMMGVLSQLDNMLAGLRPAPELPKMNDELLDILGRPNFHCRDIAARLRQLGHAIRHKSEHEQAATIHFLLNLYLKHGADWREKAVDELKLMPGAAA